MKYLILFLFLLNCSRDISFDPTTIRKLLMAKEDFVCAPYPKKFIDWKPEDI